MKKSILLVVFALFATVSFAQSNITPIVKGSLNLSNYYGSDANGSSTLVGGRIGVGTEFPINEMFSIQPTLYLSHKGEKVDNIKVHQWYLDMPIDAQMRFNVAQGTNLTVAAGPYIAYGIFGKIKENGYSTDTFGDNGLIKRFDAGLNFEVGLEFGKFLVGGSYEMGLVKVGKDAKIDNITFQAGKAYNSNFSINVGYRF